MELEVEGDAFPTLKMVDSLFIVPTPDDCCELVVGVTCKTSVLAVPAHAGYEYGLWDASIRRAVEQRSAPGSVLEDVESARRLMRGQII